MSSTFLGNESIEYERKVYNLLDLFGDLGGFVEVLIGIAAVFICPLSEFSFNLSAIKKLYVAR
jgi:hypothetical protein